MRTTGHLDKTFSTTARSRPSAGVQFDLGDAVLRPNDCIAHPGHGVAACVDRDRELLILVAISIGHVMVATRVGRTAAYRRVAALVDAGLLERVAPLRGELALIRATRAGLCHAGLDALPVARVTAAGVEHWLHCATVVLHLEEEFAEAGARLLVARELILSERIEGRSIAGTRLFSHGREALHRPDLAVLVDAG